MSFETTFRHGLPRMIDYTPSTGNVAGGQVVLLGNTSGLSCGIAHNDIVNNVRGALAVGGGVYEVINKDNAANDAKVYWDDSTNKITTTSTNNAQFGYVVRDGGGGANSNCLVLHYPFM
jgi:predicted RecA/RadA family phage recombinase